MKFIVGKPEETKVEHPTRIWCEQRGDGVCVMASNPSVFDGVPLYVAKISGNGLHRHRSLPKGFGFAMDGDRIASCEKE